MKRFSTKKISTKRKITQNREKKFRNHNLIKQSTICQIFYISYIIFYIKSGNSLIYQIFPAYHNKQLKLSEQSDTLVIVLIILILSCCIHGVQIYNKNCVKSTNFIPKIWLILRVADFLTSLPSKTTAFSILNWTKSVKMFTFVLFLLQKCSFSTQKGSNLSIHYVFRGKGFTRIIG